MFRKILIANRGEIAVRIAATFQQMGVRVVAVHSDTDRRARHVAAADEAYPLDGTSASETYLRQDKILQIAQAHGVDAIHPGYGFLSENAEFAEACAEAGITFIGPTPQAIRLLGDKVAAKQIARQVNVPVVPGWVGTAAEDPKAIAAEADGLGYPILIKAAAGGGGRGMRLVHARDELPAAFDAARREAKAAFGDDRVFLEKYLVSPRHVEIQVIGDRWRHVVHLFERECTIQRRYQKIIEESPSPALTPEVREQMTQAAVRLAQASSYTNAGTVEFILDENLNFYYLETNARLQVEHPVTELVTRMDLVAAQAAVAAGESLSFAQDDINPAGHALECRICAEDPANDFLPSTGRIDRFVPPSGPNVRVDAGVDEGEEVTVYFDPLLAKVIVWGETRAEAIERMLWALKRFVVLGVATNLAFLLDVLSDPNFRAGTFDTGFLGQYRAGGGIAAKEDADLATLLAALAAHRDGPSRRVGPNDGHAAEPVLSPWRTAGSWRGLR